MRRYEVSFKLDDWTADAEPPSNENDEWLRRYRTRFHPVSLIERGMVECAWVMWRCCHVDVIRSFWEMREATFEGNAAARRLEGVVAKDVSDGQWVFAWKNIVEVGWGGKGRDGRVVVGWVEEIMRGRVWSETKRLRTRQGLSRIEERFVNGFGNIVGKAVEGILKVLLALLFLLLRFEFVIYLFPCIRS